MLRDSARSIAGMAEGRTPIKKTLHEVRKQLETGKSLRGVELTAEQILKLRSKEASLLEKREQREEVLGCVGKQADRVIDAITKHIDQKLEEASQRPQRQKKMDDTENSTKAAAGRPRPIFAKSARRRSWSSSSPRSRSSMRPNKKQEAAAVAELKALSGGKKSRKPEKDVAETAPRLSRELSLRRSQPRETTRAPRNRTPSRTQPTPA